MLFYCILRTQRSNYMEKHKGHLQPHFIVFVAAAAGEGQDKKGKWQSIALCHLKVVAPCHPYIFPL